MIQISCTDCGLTLTREQADHHTSGCAAFVEQTRAELEPPREPALKWEQVSHATWMCTLEDGRFGTVMRERSGTFTAIGRDEGGCFAPTTSRASGIRRRHPCAKSGACAPPTGQCSAARSRGRASSTSRVRVSATSFQTATADRSTTTPMLACWDVAPLDAWRWEFMP